MIPKIIHMMWIPGLEQAPPEQRANPVKWRDMNPSYELRMWNEESIREFIEEFYGDCLDAWDSLDKPIKKSDLARLLIIHKYGGVYLDMDLIPQTPLDVFFDDPVIYNKHLKLTRHTPQIPSKDLCDKSRVKCWLSKEHCAIDEVGQGVANGILIAEPGQEWLLDFVMQQKDKTYEKVLDYVGVWALTRYIRKNISQLTESGVATLPPHYFLWEPGYFKRPPEFYTIAVHPAVNSWGDHTREDWYNV